MLNPHSSRRGFLKQTALLSAGTLLVPKFLQDTRTGSFRGKRIIVIQLSGGNDGLNTVIPFRNDILLSQRRGLVPDAGKLLSITDEAALNPALKAMASLYEKGDLCVISSVGYPNPNRSHFRAMDIWHSASDADQYLETGWLGRYLDSQCPPDAPVTAVEMGNILSLALKGKVQKGLPVQDVNQLYRTTRDLKTGDDHDHEHELADFLYRTMADTRQSAAYLFEKQRLYKMTTDFPDDPFGKSLKQVAQMIGAGVETPVYYTSLGGFDTHNNQSDRQGRLLSSYDAALDALRNELKRLGEWENTLIMTFSEFGRRVAMNASGGTDHGKANYVFLAGGGLKKAGFYDGLPDLTNLDEGDVKYRTDFRQVYATVLENWLGAPSKEILGGEFARLTFV